MIPAISGNDNQLIRAFFGTPHIPIEEVCWIIQLVYYFKVILSFDSIKYMRLIGHVTFVYIGLHYILTSHLPIEAEM